MYNKARSCNPLIFKHGISGRPNADKNAEKFLKTMVIRDSALGKSPLTVT